MIEVEALAPAFYGLPFNDLALTEEPLEEHEGGFTLRAARPGAGFPCWA